MKFKVGDKVKIKENLLCKGYDVAYFASPMKKYKDKEAKITYISPYDGTCHLDIDDGIWWWSEDMLEPYTSKIAKKDLRDGDYCVFKNGDKAIKIGNYVGTHNAVVPLREYNNKLEHNFNPRRDIIRIDRPVEYKTIYKNDEILDSTEKKYLETVIRPFKDRIESVTKIDGSDKQYIKIKQKESFFDGSITLPYFKSGTMYVGMKSNKEYTLEELGL